VSDLKTAALATITRLADAGHTAYFAGGCVRDMLLGTEPKDYDIATSATPDEVQELFPKSNAIGAHFGVILVHKTASPLRLLPFGMMAPTKMADTLIVLPSPPQRTMLLDVISPSTGCFKIQTTMKSSTLSTASRTSKQASFAPLAIPANVFKKTHYA